MRCKQMFFALVAMLSCFVLSANAQYVAKIGETEYKTLKEAVTAASAGQTITFIADINGDVTINKSLTIDGAGKQYTGNIAVKDGSSVAATIKNVNFVDGSGYAITTNSIKSITVENCTVTNYGYGFLYANKSTPTVTVKDVTVDGGNYGFHWVYGTSATLENVKMIDVANGLYIQNYANKTITLKNCEISSIGIWERDGRSGIQTFKFKGVNEVSSLTTSEYAVVDAEAQNGNKIGSLTEIVADAKEGDTVKLLSDNEAVITMPEGVNLDKNDFTADGIKVVAVKIGEQGYESLSAAVAAAKASDVITFVADITEDVTIKKSVTIDGAGKQYTGNIAVKDGSSVAATIKNVNFVDGSGYAITTNSIKSITVENCTVTNYGYGFLYANKSTPTVTVKDVTVDGGNYGFHWVYGTSATLENVKMIDVANGLYIQNYANKTITLKNCEISSIGIWERDGRSGIQTFKFEGVNEVSSLTTSSYAKIVAGAQVGTKLYETLDAAFAAAQDNDEVKVLTAGTYALSTSGKNLTITGAVDGVVFDNIGAKNMGSANVTFNNVTFDYYPNVNYTGLQHSGDLVYNNCTINGQVFLYGQSETFNNCTFNQNSADAYNVWTYGAKDVDFNECTFNSVGKSVLVYTESTTATNDVAFTNCELIASAPVDGKAAIEIDTSLSAGATITVDGATTATGFANGNVSGNSLWNNKKGNADAANNDVTVVVNDVTVLAPIPDVAKIGETGYRTLAKAIEAANAGETITLIADVTEDITVNKNVAIDGAGKTYTGKMNITSNKGTVTIKNVNFDGKGYNGYAVETRGVYYLTVEDCTAKNYGYGFLQMVNSTVLTTVKNVTVSDMNYGVKVDYATAVVLENVDMTARVAAVLNSNYGEKTITIKDSKLNIYGTWTRNNTTKTNVVFEGANTVGEFKADAAIDNFKLAAGATLTAPEAITATTDVDGCEVAYVDGKYSVVEKKNYVVRIGDEYYETLQDAINAAQDGDTVKMIDDVELGLADAVSNKSGQKVLANVDGKNITLNMNGKKISVVHRSTLAAERIFAVICVEDGAGLTVTGEGSINVTTDITDANVMPKVAYMFWKRGTTGYLVIENGNYYMDNSEDSMVYTNGNNIVTVKDGTFILDAKGTRVNGFPWIFNAAGNDERYITVLGGTYNYDICNQFWKYEVKLGEGCAIKDNGDDIWTVIKVGAYVAESADGNNKPYSSLAEAVAAAQDGNIVTLAVDAVGEGIVINKSITIDFNGKTYTFDGGVGSTGTETLGLQIMKDNNVTLKNGTLTSTGEKVKMLIQNYANLDVVDMNLNDETDCIQYVLSSNYGKTQILGKTNITTDAVAFDSYDYTKYYPAPAVVIVKTEGTIEGAIEKSEKATIEIYSGTYTMDVDEWCADGYATVDNHDGTWTVESLYVESMVLNTDTYANFEVQNEKKVANLRLIRNMRYDAAQGVSMVDKWTGIYLPFALPVSALGEDYEVAYFNDIHCYDKDEDGKIDDMAVEYVKIKSGTLYPNTPYAIKPKKEDAVTMDIVLGNVTLVPTGENNNVIECSSAFVTFQFGGVYNLMTATELLENVNTTYLSIEKTPIAYLYWNGKLNTDLENPEIMAYYPFQVYMTLCAKDGSPYELDTEKLSTIGSRVVGEENDGVTTIYDVPEEMDVEGLIFDLSGRRVNETEKGIYIKDGKKVLVK